MRLPPTPSQTVGPYFGIALTPDSTDRYIPDGYPRPIALVGPTRLVDDRHPEAITLAGTVWDGAGQPVPEAMLEVWQADRYGRYHRPEDQSEQASLDEGFLGFGRCHTTDEGRYEFLTVKPGRVPAVGGGMQAPHINLAIFGGGLLKPLRTRIYFSDEAEANAEDPTLASIDDGKRRSLLVAQIAGRIASFDIYLHSDSETPFFDV